MSNFTKGKWIYDDESNYIFNDDKQMTIAQIRGWGYLTQELGLSDDEAYEVQQANARLIENAPEMYKFIEFAFLTKDSRHLDWEGLVKSAGELLARIDGKEV